VSTQSHIKINIRALQAEGMDDDKDDDKDNDNDKEDDEDDEDDYTVLAM
jgi:hypothetical protein